MNPTSIPFGTIRPAPGPRTTVSALIICCCRRRPRTGWSMPVSTVTCVDGTNPPTTCRSTSIWIYKPAEGRQGQAASALLAPRLQPVAQIDRSQCALVFVRLSHGAVVELRDPGLIGTRIVLGERKPHQSARSLPRHVIAFEQHGAEHRLRFTLAFLR